MSTLTQDQMVKIVLLYGKYENYQKVRNEYAKFYGIVAKPREVPNIQAIKRVVERFLGTGSVHKKPGGGRPKGVRTEGNRARIKELVKAKNSLSIRGIAFQIDVEQTAVWRMLRKVVNNIILCKISIFICLGNQNEAVQTENGHQADRRSQG